MHDRLRHALLGRWAALMCDHAGAVLLAAALLAGVSIWITAAYLGFEADRNALLSDELDWNQRYESYKERFGGRDQIVVVVQVPEDADGKLDTPRAEAFVDALADRLRDRPHLASVTHRIEAAPVLARLLPLDEFRERVGEMPQARPLLESVTPGELLSRLANQLREGDSGGGEQTPAQAAAQIDRITRFVDLCAGVLAGEPITAESASTRLGFGERWQRLVSDDGVLMFVDLEIRPAPDELDPAKPAVEEARAAVVATRAQFPGVEAGLTGISVMEADETVVSMTDSTRCSVLALAAIATLMVVAFHGWQLPLMAVAALMVGTAWAFGFLTVAVGHLQVLSVVFTVILFGLGIDFGIHLISKFELARREHPDTREGFRATMIETLQSTGPGIVTGAITTAVAFSTTLLTDFQGMAEMGLIAGVGVMLCLLAMFSVLPALMRRFWHARRRVKAGHERLVDFHAHRYLTPLVHRPWVTLAVAALIVAVCGVLSLQVRYDNNLINLLPDGLESTIWQQRVLDHSDQAIWYGVYLADDLDEARAMTQRFRTLEQVASVGGAGTLFPENEREKLAAAAPIRAQMQDLIDDPIGPALPETPDEFRQRLTGLSTLLSFAMNRADVRDNPPVAAALGELKAALDRTLAVMATDGFEQNATDHMARLQGLFEDVRERVRASVDGATLQRPMAPGDLPPYLSSDLASRGKPVSYQLKVYPRENVWDPEDLEPFIEAVRSVGGESVTGSPVQIYESGKLMKESYRFAGVLALGAVLVLVYLDFGKLSDALLCLLPVFIGFVVMLGLMALAGVAINPANIIVLPLMFGIGVDAGVHIVHRYQQDRRAMPPGLSHGTGKGIILTSATTIIGFGVMMLARHRGIQSLGYVLTAGIGATAIACLTVMPALLALRNRYHVWRRYRQWKRIGREAGE